MLWPPYFPSRSRRLDRDRLQNTVHLANGYRYVRSIVLAIGIVAFHHDAAKLTGTSGQWSRHVSAHAQVVRLGVESGHSAPRWLGLPAGAVAQNWESVRVLRTKFFLGATMGPRCKPNWTSTAHSIGYARYSSPSSGTISTRRASGGCPSMEIA